LQTACRVTYESPAGGLDLGVGYADEDAQHAHFVTGDGENRVRVVSKCRVLVEPIRADRLPGVVALRDNSHLRFAGPARH